MMLQAAEHNIAARKGDARAATPAQNRASTRTPPSRRRQPARDEEEIRDSLSEDEQPKGCSLFDEAQNMHHQLTA